MKLTRKQLKIIRSQLYLYYPTLYKLKASWISYLEKPFTQDFNDKALDFLDSFLCRNVTDKFLNTLFQNNPELYQKLKSPKLGHLVFIEIIKNDTFKKACQKAQLVNHYILDKSNNREYPCPLNEHKRLIPLILKTHPELTTRDEKKNFVDQQLEFISIPTPEEKVFQDDHYQLPKSVLKFDQPLYLDKHQSFLKYIKAVLKHRDAIQNVKGSQCVLIDYYDKEANWCMNIHTNLTQAMDELLKLGQGAINRYIEKINQEQTTPSKLTKLLNKYYQPHYQDQETNPIAEISDIFLTDDLSRERTLTLVLKNPLK